MNINAKQKEYSNIRSHLSNLSVQMYKEHWNDIKIIEEDGIYSEALENASNSLNRLNNMLSYIDQEVTELKKLYDETEDNAIKDRCKLLLSTYSTILEKL